MSSQINDCSHIWVNCDVIAINKILELFMPYKGDFLNLVIASGLTWGLASVIVYCIVLVKRKI